MNDRQLLCFLVVSRTLNFSRASRELFITQPALSYQIRSLEKELEVELFERNTTHVRLTPAGLAFLGPARSLYRQYLEACNSVKPFVHRNKLVLQLPAVMTLRDPIYHSLIQQLNETWPEAEISIRTDPPDKEFHHLLSTGVDALIGLAPEQLQPEVAQDFLFQTQCYLATGPAHPLHSRAVVCLWELRGQTLFYEPSERVYIGCLRAQAEAQGLPIHWAEVASFELCYSGLLAGRGLFVSPLRYDIFPQEWYLPLQLKWPLPGTCLMTLRDDPRPQIAELRQIFREAYQKWSL